METRRLLELVAATACTSVALANTAPAATAGQPKPGHRPVPILMYHVFAAGAFTLAGQALEPGVPRVLANL